MRTVADPVPSGPEEGDARLLDVAASVAEGASVDWADRAADAPELTGALSELQALARMGELLRAEAPAPPASAPAFRWGELEAIERLGAGVGGEVWRAWDPTLEREVALKLAPAGAAPSRPIEEARRLARLRHPNVVAVLGVDVLDGRAGLWMERLEGHTLEQRLAEQGTFGAHEATGIGLELCRALAAVHAAGLVHGDVSPRNVMRERGGRIVLMDLGSASGSGDDRAAFVTGTPLVTAPEVLDGAPPSVASDLYALGSLLFRLVTGRYPVEATTLAALREAHAGGQRARLRLLRPDLPGPFVQVVEQAIATDPAARHADSAAFEQALAASLGPEAQARHAMQVRDVRRAWGRQLAPAALLSAAALLALIATTQWLGTRPAPEPTRAAEPASPSPGAAPVVSAEAAPPALAVAAWVRTRDGVGERVESGGLVRVGDELSLDVRSAEPLHLYVLNEDDAGAVFTLFPVAGSDLSNPVPAGRTLALPGARSGEAMHWQVSSPAQRERFLVIASRTPLAALEARLAAMPAVREDEPLAYAELDASALEQLRGVGRIKPATPGRRRGGRLDAVADALAGETGVWLREVELLHER